MILSWTLGAIWSQQESWPCHWVLSAGLGHKFGHDLLSQHQRVDPIVLLEILSMEAWVWKKCGSIHSHGCWGLTDVVTTGGHLYTGYAPRSGSSPERGIVIIITRADRQTLLLLHLSKLLHHAIMTVACIGGWLAVMTFPNAGLLPFGHCGRCEIDEKRIFMLFDNI